MNSYIRAMIPDRHRRRVLLSIIAVIGVYGLTVGLLYPLISLNMEARGYSRTMIGLMGMMPFVASVIASPLIPAILRRVNITRLVAVCIVGDLLMIMAMPFFNSIYAWFVIRFMMGVVGTGLFVASETWINEIAEDRYRGRILGIYTFTISITFAIAPLFIVVLGVDGYAPFIVPALCMSVALLPLWWTRDSKPDFSEGTAAQVFKFILLAPVLVTAAAIVSFEEAAIVTMLPVYAVRSGLTPEHAAFLLTVAAGGSVLAQPIVGWLADSVNRVGVLIGCAAAVLLGTATLPFALHSWAFLWLVIILWGGGVAGIYTVGLTLMGQKFRGAQLVAGNAAFGLMWGVAGSGGPAIAGPLMDLWDPHGFVVAIVGVAALFLIFVLVRIKRVV